MKYSNFEIYLDTYEMLSTMMLEGIVQLTQDYMDWLCSLMSF